MLSHISDFLDDSTGIEKALRLAQGLCTALGGLAPTATAAAPYATAKAQINLGRRYLRLHKWFPCFKTAHAHSARTDVASLEKLLEVAKWSFLGLYFLLEMPTITNAMSITSFDWGPGLQKEALKNWFYGISWSIVLGVYQLVMLYLYIPTPAASPARADSKESTGTESSTPATETASTAETAATRSKIHRQLAIDLCDIFLPGSAVGWIPVGPVMVGTCQSVSSVLAMQQIWERTGRGA